MPQQVIAAGASGHASRAAASLLPALPPCDRAQQAASSLLLLLPRLEAAIVPDPRRAPPSSSRATPSDPRRAPWSSPVASALFQAAASAHHAAGLLSPAAPPPVRSWRDASRSLQRLPALLPGAPPPAQHLAARVLEAALSAALRALGDEETPRPLPRAPHSPPPLCPNSCHLPSLRMLPLEGRVFCVSPHCRDSAGFRRPSARLYPARASDGGWCWQLVWRDGLTGLTRDEEGKEARA
jgi:hypothetical protein